MVKERTLSVLPVYNNVNNGHVHLSNFAVTFILTYELIIIHKLHDTTLLHASQMKAWAKI